MKQQAHKQQKQQTPKQQKQQAPTQEKKQSQQQIRQRTNEWLGIQELSPKPEGSPSKVFIFDFDETLTNIHSGGYAYPGSGYFMRPEFKKIQKMLKDLNENNIWVYIATRGVVNAVDQDGTRYGVGPYLQWCELSPYIRKVFGAKTGEDIASETVNSKTWGIRKRKIIDMIMDETGARPENVYFFDDDRDNINSARKDIHAIHVSSEKTVVYPTTVDEVDTIMRGVVRKEAQIERRKQRSKALLQQNALLRKRTIQQRIKGKDHPDFTGSDRLQFGQQL